LAVLKGAAVRPSARVRRLAAIVLGVLLEGLLTLVGDWHERYPGVAVAAGLLIAALAGAVGGIWSGLVVAGAGWTLYFFFVADEALESLPALAAWLAVGGLAGWLATSRRRSSRQRSLVSGELAAVRDSAAEAIVGIDLEGAIVSWSAGAEDMYGYEAGEAVGQAVSLLAPEADGDDALRPAVATQLG
jgi:PAS domain-containing protein